MVTSVMRTDTQTAFNEAVDKAAELINKGEIVGIPTETVYGLGANAMDEKAISKIFIAKGRPQDNPLIVHISDISMLDGIVSEIGEIREKLIKSFWPGPLTVIFPKSQNVPTCVTAGLDTVAIRMPSHKVAREIIARAKVPVAAPSANLSGKPSTTSAEHVYSDLNGKIPLVVDGGSSQIGLESTVVAVKGNAVTVLRPGGITLEMIKEAVPEADVQVAEAVLRPLQENEEVLSPGMKHKHYSPVAKVILCEGSEEKILDFVSSFKGKNAVFIGGEEMCKKIAIDCMPYGNTDDDEARHIFEYLRDADEKGYGTVILSLADEKGIGLALNNRLLRAAGFEVTRL